MLFLCHILKADPTKLSLGCSGLLEQQQALLSPECCLWVGGLVAFGVREVVLLLIPGAGMILFLCAAVIPVGTAGTIHYQLASIPYTSGKFLGLDLDVS